MSLLIVNSTAMTPSIHASTPSEEIKIALTWIKHIRDSFSSHEAALEWALNTTDKTSQHLVMACLFGEQPDKYLGTYVGYLSFDPKRLQDFPFEGSPGAANRTCFAGLADFAPRAVLFKMMSLSISHGTFYGFGAGQKDDVLAIAAESILGDGKQVFDALQTEAAPPVFYDELRSIAHHAPSEADECVTDIARKAFANVAANPDKLGWYWRALSERPSVARRFTDDFKRGFEVEKLRGSAKSMLKVALGDDGVNSLTMGLWESRISKKQILAIQVTAESANSEEKQRLLDWLSQKPRADVTKKIHRALSRLNVPIPTIEQSAAELNSRAIRCLQKERETLRAPKFSWLNLLGLPVLRNRSGGELDHMAQWFILSSWSRNALGRYGNASVLLEEFMEELDHKTTADFGLHVLHDWLASDQDAKDGKWVIPLAGILGDDRVICTLLPWIDRWATQSSVIFAKKAIWYIGRIASERSLVELSGLADHFRGRSKQLHEICVEAHEFAAAKRKSIDIQQPENPSQ